MEQMFGKTYFTKAPPMDKDFLASTSFVSSAEVAQGSDAEEQIIQTEQITEADTFDLGLPTDSLDNLIERLINRIEKGNYIGALGLIDHYLDEILNDPTLTYECAVLLEQVAKSSFDPEVRRLTQGLQVYFPDTISQQPLELFTSFDSSEIFYAIQDSAEDKPIGLEAQIIRDNRYSSQAILEQGKEIDGCSGPYIRAPQPNYIPAPC